MVAWLAGLTTPVSVAPELVSAVAGPGTNSGHSSTSVNRQLGSKPRIGSPDTIITTAVTPIAMLLLFVYVFGGAIDVGGGNYVSYLLPGILLVTVASGIASVSPFQIARI